MALRKRGGIWYFRKTINGQLFRESTGFADKKSAERRGSESVRPGTLSLYAALEVSTGRVHGKTAQRHTSEEFLGFCEQVVATQPAGREIHLIVDNLSAHKTKAV